MHQDRTGSNKIQGNVNSQLRLYQLGDIKMIGASRQMKRRQILAHDVTIMINNGTNKKIKLNTN